MNERKKLTPHFRPHPSPIDSRNHPTIKRIRRLHQRAERDRSGLFYVEGMRFVARAIEQHAIIETLVSCRPLLTHPFARHLVHQQRRAGTPMLEVTPEVLYSLALAEDPQGLGAVLRQRWEPLKRVTPQGELCWLLLETVRSAGNLGTMLRTSEAVGGAGVIVLGQEIDPYDPAAVRASMGPLFAQRVVRAGTAEVVDWKRRHGCHIIGAAPSASLDYQAVSYPPPAILALGGERKGLSPSLQALCDATVRIPMVGAGDSLNLAVATGVLLYEVFNQRRPR